MSASRSRCESTVGCTMWYAGCRRATGAVAGGSRSPGGMLYPSSNASRWIAPSTMFVMRRCTNKSLLHLKDTASAAAPRTCANYRRKGVRKGSVLLRATGAKGQCRSACLATAAPTQVVQTAGAHDGVIHRGVDKLRARTLKPLSHFGAIHHLHTLRLLVPRAHPCIVIRGFEFAAGSGMTRAGSTTTSPGAGANVQLPKGASFR